MTRTIAPALIWIAVMTACPAALRSQAESPLTDVSAIVARMEEHNRWRASALAGYSGVREYRVEYKGIVHKTAEMVVQMTFVPPETKQFKVISESGSGLLRGRVLKPLLAAETESAQASKKRESSISPENYSFRLLSFEGLPGEGRYVLEAVPRKKTKFLFQGKVWVDARDFAVVRVEGAPAVNPSWWIKQTTIVHAYTKAAGFWFPETNESNTRVRLGGRAVLTIRYRDYQVSKPEPATERQ